jgi:hypothetical protein
MQTPTATWIVFDLAVWKTQFGATGLASSTSSSSVPEPSTVLLLIFAAAGSRLSSRGNAARVSRIVARDIRQQPTVFDRSGYSQELTRLMAQLRRAGNSSPRQVRHAAAILSAETRRQTNVI